MLVMKKALKILGIILGVTALLLASAAAYVQFAPMPVFEVKPPVVQLPADSASLAKGKNIVELVCAHCHMGADSRLSGRLFNRPTDPFGEIWSANITRHPTKGIGRYTDGELAYLMRTGVNRDGRMVGYMMCHPNMSDHDLASIIAYLRSDADVTQPVDITHPKPAYLTSFMGKAIMKLGLYKPLPYDGQPKTAPSPSDKVAYGRYLATEMYECAGCHSANFETLDPINPEQSPGYFGGGNPIVDEEFNPFPSANLTPSKDHGIGNWTEEQFVTAVRTGVRPDQRLLQHQMPRFARLSDEELSAIWAYLQTVPALETTVAAKVE